MSDMTKSSVNLVPTCRQLSEQDAVHHSMVTELLSSNSAETTVTVLLLILEGFVKETLSADSMALSIGRAIARMKELGMNNADTQAIIQNFAKWAEAHRQRNPFSSMF